MSSKYFRSETLSEYTPTVIADLQVKPEKPRISILNFLIAPMITIVVYILIFSVLMPGSGTFYMFFIISAVLGLIMSVIHYISDQNHWKEECERIETENQRYFSALESKCSKQAAQYKNDMLNSFPDVENQASWSWVRVPRQKTFLQARIGIFTGPNPARLYFHDSNMEKVFRDQYLRRIHQLSYIKDIPYTIDLRKHDMIGIYGGWGMQNLNALIMNICMFHSEDDVRIAVINNRKEFEWCKRIPHANGDRCAALYASVPQEIYDLHSNLIALAQEKPKELNVVIMTSELYLQVEPLRRLGTRDRFLTIVLCEQYPPSCCDMIIGDQSVAYSDEKGKTEVQLDMVSNTYVEDYAKAFSARNRQNENGMEKKKLPEYLDGFSFFQNDKNI